MTSLNDWRTTIEKTWWARATKWPTKTNVNTTNDADDKRGPSFFLARSWRRIFVQSFVIHGRSAGAQRGVYQLLRHVHLILIGVAVLNAESAGQSASASHSVTSTSSWSECQYSTRSLLATPLQDGASVLQSESTWLLSFPPSLGLAGGLEDEITMAWSKKWLTSSPTAPPHTNSPHIHPSKLPHHSQHTHNTFRAPPYHDWCVRVPTCQAQNNNHKWVALRCFYLFKSFPRRSRSLPACTSSGTQQLSESVASETRPSKKKKFRLFKPQSKQRVTLCTGSPRLLHQPLGPAARLVSSQVGSGLNSASTLRPGGKSLFQKGRTWQQWNARRKHHLRRKTWPETSLKRFTDASKFEYKEELWSCNGRKNKVCRPCDRWERHRNTRDCMQPVNLYGVAGFVNRTGARQNVAATDAYALSCTTSTCPWRWRSRPRRTTRTYCAAWYRLQQLVKLTNSSLRRSFALAIVIMQVKFASSKPMRIPVLGNRAFGYLVNVSNPTESMCISTVKSIRCYRREEEYWIYQGFKDLDVTRVTMVPHQIRNSMVSAAQCIIVQRRAPPPCKRVNQEQSDKIMRSWPRRFPRGRTWQYHSLARWKAIPIEDSTYVLGVVVETRCGRRGWRESIHHLLGKQQSRENKNLRAIKTDDDNSREVHKDTVNQMRRTNAKPYPGTSLNFALNFSARSSNLAAPSFSRWTVSSCRNNLIMNFDTPASTSIHFRSRSRTDTRDTVLVGFGRGSVFATRFPVPLSSTLATGISSEVSVTCFLIPFTMRTQEPVPSQIKDSIIISTNKRPWW